MGKSVKDTRTADEILNQFGEDLKSGKIKIADRGPVPGKKVSIPGVTVYEKPQDVQPIAKPEPTYKPTKEVEEWMSLTPFQQDIAKGLGTIPPPKSDIDNYMKFKTGYSPVGSSIGKAATMASPKDLEWNKMQPWEKTYKFKKVQNFEKLSSDAEINTVQSMAEAKGEGRPNPGTSTYEKYKKEFDFKYRPLIGDKVVLTNDPFGNPVYGEQMGFWESASKGYSDYFDLRDTGFKYVTSSRDEIKKMLNTKYNGGIIGVKDNGTKEYQLIKEPGQIPYAIGQMYDPLKKNVIIGAGIALSAETLGLSAIASTALAGTSMMATTGTDGVMIKYAASLEEAYAMARAKGMTEDEALDAALDVAWQSAGVETLVQAGFSFTGGTMSSGIKGFSSKAMLQQPKSLTTFAKGFAQNAKQSVAMGSIFGMGRGFTDQAMEGAGIEVENKFERAVTEGGMGLAMDASMRGLMHGIGGAAKGGAKLYGSAKSFMKNLLSEDVKISERFAKEAEAAGIYPEGSWESIKQQIQSFQEAKKKTPDFNGDDVRRTIAAGLLEKRANLEKEMLQLDEAFRSPVKSQIDDINARIRRLNEVENPFEVEYKEDGTPFVTRTAEKNDITTTEPTTIGGIRVVRRLEDTEDGIAVYEVEGGKKLTKDAKEVLTDKNGKYATKVSQEPVKEGAPEGGVSQYTGAEEVQPAKAAVEEAAPKTDTGDSVVSGTQEKVSLADNVRKLKIDTSKLTGGDKGVAQSNIAGLPIEVWNTSVELVAKAVEAGEDVAKVVANVIKDLKARGLKVDEKEFTNRFIPRAEEMPRTAKARVQAEAEMAGLKSDDYTELQRVAEELYTKKVAEDSGELGKLLREYQESKMDTSKISDDVFKNIADEVKQPGFKAVVKEPTAPKVTLPSEQVAPEQILVKPREVVKAILGGAQRQAKEAKARLNTVVESVGKAIYNEKGLVVDPKALSRVVREYVNDAMTADEAAESFANNLSEIRRKAINSRTYKEIRGKINNIISTSKVKAITTVAIRKGVREMDFIAPSKIRDYEFDPSTGKLIDKGTSTELTKYSTYLDEYNSSQSGKGSNLKQARINLADFVQEKREQHEMFMSQRRDDRAASYSERYDKYLADGKIPLDEYGRPIVSKENFVDALMNPEKKVSDNVADLIDDALVDEAETFKNISRERLRLLKDDRDAGELNPQQLDDLAMLEEVDIDKISPKNQRLFNNIIEDVLNGEKASRIGEITSDINARDIAEQFAQSGERVRPWERYKKAGLLNPIKSIIDYATGSKAFDDLQFNNVIRLTFLGDFRNKARALIYGKFDAENLKVSNMSKAFLDEKSNIYRSKALKYTDENGNEVVRRFTSPKLTSHNSYRIGIAQSILQYDNPLDQVNTIAKSLIDLSKWSYDNGKRHMDYISSTLDALQSLGLISQHDYDPTTGIVTEIPVSRNITADDIVSNLNDREAFVIDRNRSWLKSISPDLQQAMLDYYGEYIDVDNPLYVSMSPRTAGEVPEVDIPSTYIDDSAPQHIRSLRSATTLRRQANMVSSVKKGAGEAIVYYDFDEFHAVPKAFQESASTAYTTEAVREMNKLMGNPEFIKFIGGGMNLTPKNFADNKVFFRQKIAEFVNRERKASIVSQQDRTIAQRVVRGLVNRILNTFDAGIRQYVPSVPQMLIYGGAEAYGISSNMIFSKAFGSAKMQNLLGQFFAKTSRSQRLKMSMEELSDITRSISNNAFFRTASDIDNFIAKYSSWTRDKGDDLVTMQTLLIGYMKGLKRQGKIKSYKDFNLETELAQGLDPVALASAEQFMAFVNNESISAKKANVFKQPGTFALRLFQGFGHNQNVNALIDVGVIRDYFEGNATLDDAKDAMVGLGMYTTNMLGYGAAVYGLGYTGRKISEKLLESMGVELNKDVRGSGFDRAKQKEEDIEKRTFIRTMVGSLVDGTTSRYTILGSEAAKFLVGKTWKTFSDAERDRRERSGEDIKGTIYDDSFEPVLVNKYGGAIGSLWEDVEIAQGIAEGTNEKNVDLIQDQKTVLSATGKAQMLASIMPFRGFSKLVTNFEKVVKNKKISQIDYDAKMYNAYLMAQEDKEAAVMYYSEQEVDEAINYITENQKNPRFKDYLIEKVRPYSQKVLFTDNIYAGAEEAFGTATAKIIRNISEKDEAGVLKVMTNRYAGKDLTDKEVLYLVQNSVISPREYALAGMFDKDMKLRNDIPESEIVREVMQRQFKAQENVGLSNMMRGKGNYTPLTDDQIINMRREYSSKIYQQRQREK